MNHFFLCPAKPETKVTDDQVALLRTIAGLRVSRMGAYIVEVHFTGDEQQLRSLLVNTMWGKVYRSENRPYYLQ